jgi:predicted RNA methylase
VISAADLSACTTADAALALLRDLGYPVQPVALVPAEWRRAGIDVPWNGSTNLLLAARTPQLDVYLVNGDEAHDSAAAERFLRSLQAYNAIVKPAMVAVSPGRLTLYDLSARRALRRLDVDLAHPSAHAVDRVNLLAAGDDAARIFDRALDRESLSRQFFERFRRAAAEVGAAVGDAQQSLLILSRLLFLYFIQQKGWLGGERRFVVDRLDAALRQQRDFYATVLEPLFFGCLNTDRRERTAVARKLGDIPYLNGGLFEPSPFERANAVALPNELMQRVIEDVFERFDFSIDESDAAGTHVDPEMLGKVFESLMADDERAASGSFYTPREIVDVLASRAIVESLAGGDERTRDVLEAIVRGETPARIPNAAALRGRIESITVLDPACGSGAFLLSALHLLERIAAATGARVSRRDLVERALYGVDLKPEAVRLCELRLWLAIVSRSDEEIASIPPLPNLDRNILQGNSLLSPTDFLGDNRGDVYRDWRTAVRAQSDLIGRYRGAPQKERPALARLIRANDQRLASELLSKAIDLDDTELQRLAAPQRDLFGRLREMNLARCRELHERIRENRRALDRVENGELAFFSFDVHFAHVISRGGFDVVIGNPPWVRNSRIDAKTKAMLNDRYALFGGGGSRDAAAFHQPDLSIAFAERALALAAPHGAVSLLLPAKVLNAAYAAPLRRHIESKLSVVALDDWSADARRYFDADTFPLGMTLSKRTPSSRPALTLGGSEWVLLPTEVHTTLARIHRQFPPLAETLSRTPVMGVKSGDNSAFFLDVKRVRRNAVETTDGLHIPLSAVCRCVRGRDVRRWSIGEPAWMLWPPSRGFQRFAAARGLDANALQLAYVRPEHLGIKVVWKDLSRGICAAVLTDARTIHGRSIPLVPNQTLYALDAANVDEAHVLAALLNSTIVNALAAAVAERAKDFYFRYFGRTIARLPLPRVESSGEAWPILLRCARRAARDPGANEEIDRVVAGLYGVSAEEHERLAAYLRRRLGFAGDD